MGNEALRLAAAKPEDKRLLELAVKALQALAPLRDPLALPALLRLRDALTAYCAGKPGSMLLLERAVDAVWAAAWDGDDDLLPALGALLAVRLLPHIGKHCEVLQTRCTVNSRAEGQLSIWQRRFAVLQTLLLRNSRELATLFIEAIGAWGVGFGWVGVPCSGLMSTHT